MDDDKIRRLKELACFHRAEALASSQMAEKLEDQVRELAGRVRCKAKARKTDRRCKTNAMKNSKWCSVHRQMYDKDYNDYLYLKRCPEDIDKVNQEREWHSLPPFEVPEGLD